MPVFLASVSELSSPGIYLGWGNFLIQFGNFIVIALMLALFAPTARAFRLEHCFGETADGVDDFLRGCPLQSSRQ